MVGFDSLSKALSVSLYWPSSHPGVGQKGRHGNVFEYTRLKIKGLVGVLNQEAKCGGRTGTKCQEVAF